MMSGFDGRSTTTRSFKLNLFSIFDEGKKALVKKMAGDYDSDKVKARITGLINDNPVLMLSFTTCPYCIKAKEILKNDQYKDLKMTVLELDLDDEGKAIRAELGDFIGRTSVPAVWVSGVFIGGCNDGPEAFGGVAKLHEQNKLYSMFQEAKAI